MSLLQYMMISKGSSNKSCFEISREKNRLLHGSRQKLKNDSLVRDSSRSFNANRNAGIIPKSNDSQRDKLNKPKHLKNSEHSNKGKRQMIGDPELTQLDFLDESIHKNKNLTSFTNYLKNTEGVINTNQKDESLNYVLSFNPSRIIEVNSDAENSKIRKKSTISKLSQPEGFKSEKEKKKSSSNSVSLIPQTKSQNLSKRDSQGQLGGRCKSISLKYSKSGISVDTTSGYKYFGKSGTLVFINTL
jgi:hypothetical protein